MLPNIKLLETHNREKINVGLKDLAKPGPFHIKPKAHVEKEEMSEDE